MAEKISDNKYVRAAFLVAGFISLIIGIIGLFLPIMPTVPLLVIAAACFARSSETFHRRLLESPRFGPMIADYMAGKGIPLRAKVLSIGGLWISVLGSTIFFIQLPWLKVVMIAVAVGVTIYLVNLPTRRPQTD